MFYYKASTFLAIIHHSVIISKPYEDSRGNYDLYILALRDLRNVIERFNARLSWKPIKIHFLIVFNLFPLKKSQWLLFNLLFESLLRLWSWVALHLIVITVVNIIENICTMLHYLAFQCFYLSFAHTKLLFKHLLNMKLLKLQADFTTWPILYLWQNSINYLLLLFVKLWVRNLIESLLFL